MADQKVKSPKEGHDPVDRVADLIFGNISSDSADANPKKNEDAG